MIELPFPHQILWPNGRTRSFRYKAKLVKDHRRWAALAASNFARTFEHDGGPIVLRYTVHPKPTGKAPDKDNCTGAFKSYQDGIADALKVNDSLFAEPVITFGARCKGGKIVVEIGK